jgi:hypothetical protein
MAMDTNIVLCFFVALYTLAMGGISVFLGRNNGRSFILRFWLGLFLGPIGWIICWRMKPPLSPEEAKEQQQKFDAEQAEYRAQFK